MHPFPSSPFHISDPHFHTRTTHPPSLRPKLCSSISRSPRVFPSQVPIADIRILTSQPGKSKVTISLNTLITQLMTSSTVPISRTEVRYIVTVVSRCVPWFCQIIEIGGGGRCLSGTVGAETMMGRDVGDRMNGKENELKGISRVSGIGNGGRGNGKGVEGLLIFGKRDGRLIGREEVLSQFRMKKEEYERLTKGLT